MSSSHVERDQVAQRLAPVAIRREPVPTGAQPVREQLGERRVTLHEDHLWHVAPDRQRFDDACGSRGLRRGWRRARWETDLHLRPRGGRLWTRDLESEQL